MEGKYFVWTKEQVDEVTGDAAAEVCRVFGVTEAGNWEGVTVLSLVAEAPETKSFAAARAALLAERQRRVPPGTDVRWEPGDNRRGFVTPAPLVAEDEARFEAVW